MKLSQMHLPEYMSLLASTASAPGGGTASALTGAQGASLCAMVCGLTIGKKKYLEHEALCRDALEKAMTIKDRFMGLMDRDTEAFEQVSAVFEMPKDTEEQKQLRREAMQKGLKACTLTPMEMMELAAEGIALVDSLIGKSNQSAASDLGVAALSLSAALRGAWYNVLINISGIKDEAFVGEYRARGEKLIEKALPMADAICQKIEEMV